MRFDDTHGWLCYRDDFLTAITTTAATGMTVYATITAIATTVIRARRCLCRSFLITRTDNGFYGSCCRFHFLLNCRWRYSS